MTELEPTPMTPGQPVGLSAAELKAVQRMRMTPAERQAERIEREQSVLARLPIELRQARETRATQAAAMTAEQRRAHQLSLQLVSAVRRVQEATQRGVTLAEVLAAPQGTDAETLSWFLTETQRPREATVEEAQIGVAGEGGGAGGVGNAGEVQ